jgi:micrococcal nuclease
MYEYYAEVLRVIDGDTVLLRIDKGFHSDQREKVRLLGIDTPENNTEFGQEVTAIVKAKLPPGKIVKVKTHKDKQGKYGRYLATILIGRLNLNKYLVRYGYASETDY